MFSYFQRDSNCRKRQNALNSVKTNQLIEYHFSTGRKAENRRRNKQNLKKKIKNSRNEYRQEDRIYLYFLRFELSCDLGNIEAVRTPCLQMLQAVAVLTGSAALRGSSLLQLDQGPHHGCKSHFLRPPAGLPLADTLLLQPALVTL